jgi:hypothetical protein
MCDLHSFAVGEALPALRSVSPTTGDWQRMFSDKTDLRILRSPPC